jgi:putative Ig domain-containing protein
MIHHSVDPDWSTRCMLTKERTITILCAVVLCGISLLGLTGCGGDSGPTPGGVAIATSSLPNGAVNQPYSAMLTGSGGTAPYTWSVTPALPANLSFDPATGAIAGTPTTQGTTTHTFTLRDSSTPTQAAEQTFTLTVVPPPATLTITTTSLQNGTVGQAYSRPVQATGGTGAFTWTISAGTLPPNLNLDRITGVIAGTPTATGTSSFTVRVQDTGGQSDTQALSITINTTPPPPTPPTITTTTLLAGTVNQPYNQPVQATGGTGALTWSLVPGAGTLPAGLDLNSTNGAIAGTPTAAGTSSFTVRVQDAGGLSDTQALSITINPPAPPVITTTTLPAGTLGQFYSQTVQAAGGTGARIWTISAGNLPQGLNLDQATGVISGTPIVAGPSNFTVRVQDAAGQSDTQALSIVINLSNPPIITTTALPGGTVGQPYSQTLQATGGIGALTWTVSAGSLPAMLNLDLSTGVISGTPTTAGTANFTVRVADTLLQSDTQALSIVVSAALAITTASLPDAEVGKSYNKMVNRSGGVAPFTWSVTPSLPDGLNLNTSTGQITGSPAEGTGGDYSLVFTVVDSTAPTPQTASRTLALKIKP